MVLLPLLLVLLPVLVHAGGQPTVGLHPHQIKNLVTFGDSFTDTFHPVNGGSAQWPTYAADYANLDLFPFARLGAICSDNLTYLGVPFPSLFESQLPLYFEQQSNGTLNLHPSETIYTLWIGTNDVGIYSILTGDNGASTAEVAACMVNWVKTLYDSGARDFLFQNMVPLEAIPLYAPDSYPNRYWRGSRNTTEWSLFMRQLVLSTNALTKLMLLDLARTLHDAHIGIFDSHSLFTDMYNHPELYLNGTVPFNVTGCVSSCVFQLNEPESNPGVCTEVEGTDRDSYLWYDELHPSEQASRIVAREVAQVIQGKENRWTTWLS